MTNLFRAPGSFTVTSPTITGGIAPDISQNVTIQWGGNGGDAVLIQLGLLHEAGDAYAETVSCVASASTNSISVPAGTWTTWRTGRQVDVFVGRMQAGTGTIDFNNAGSQVVGIYWLYGAGFSR